MADVLADSLFNCLMAVRFRRRGEGEEVGARTVVDRLLKGQSQHSLSSLIVTADRGYVRDSFANYIRDRRIGSIFVLPDHLSRVHPFLPAYLLRVGRDDDIEEFGNGIDGDDDFVSCNGTHHGNAEAINTSDLILPDGGSEVPASFRAI